MKRIFLIFSVLLLLISIVPLFSAGSYFLRTPSLSPDGSKVVFGYDSDLWIGSIEGGAAYRLTAMDGVELYPKFSPDGKWIAFSSSREGNFDVFIIPVMGGDIIRLTYHDSPDVVDSWSWDSKSVYFTSKRYNNFSAFKVNISGGTPERIFENFFNTVHNVIEDPKSEALYFTDTWESEIFFFRKGYKGEYNPDIKSFNPKTGELISHTKYIGKDFWPSIDKYGNVYFVSDEDTGEYNLFLLKDGKKIRLTKFQESVKFPQVNANGTRIVFEKGYKLFVYDIGEKTSSEIKVNVSGDKRLKLSKKFNIRGKIENFDISPDGEKIAFVSRGELFVSDIEGKFINKMKAGRNGRVKEVKWMGDSVSLLYNRTVNGYLNYFILKGGVEIRLTSGNFDDRNITLNSEKSLGVYLSGKRFVKMVDLKTLRSKIVAEEELWGFYNSNPYFSPDDNFIVFTAYRNFEQDIFIHNLKNGKTVNLTDSGVTETVPIWSPDGKYLFFAADRFSPVYPRGGSDMKVYMLPLEKSRSKFKSDKWEELFVSGKNSNNKSDKQSVNSGKKNKVKIDLSGIGDRWIQISSDYGEQSNPTVFKEGEKYIVFYSSNEGGDGYSLYETVIDPFKKQKTEKLKGTKGRAISIVKCKKKYYALSNGKIGLIDLKGKKFTPIKMNYKFLRNLQNEFNQMFYETWANLEINYYDENFHGKDWSRVKKYYSKFLPYLTSRSDLRLLINDMLGELNSSHLGFYSNGDEENVYYKSVTSETGIVFDREKPFNVDRILNDSPVDKKGIDLKHGDLLIEVNGAKVDYEKNRESYFSFPSLEDELNLKFKRGRELFVVKIHPESNKKLKKYLYDEWIENNQKRVDLKSKNKIAYVYMKDMGVSELKSFIIDMTTEWYKRDALILDLRYNRGGNVHDAVLNFLSRKPYTLWKYRGGKFSPQPNFAPSGKPIVLLINQQSLSDAEMMGAGFRELKLGKIVGTESYRWIIFTSGKSLVDGSYYRLPSWGCYTLDKRDLEINGVKPDIYVKNTLKDRLEGKDPQLDKAIEIIMKQLKSD